ncbi:MAG: Eco29kI family restriction endonuclease [Candidatus Competibacteraceae bacterium]
MVALAETAELQGAGVYAIYYTGPFPAYEPIVKLNRNDEFWRPIYVGKAIPKGGRKGGITADASKGTALRDRLRQHAASIEQANNLELQDFYYRCLMVDDIWIPLGENMLIETFKPIWNIVIDGFGNKDPGNRRATQYRSSWDTLHPGRAFAEKLAGGGTAPEKPRANSNATLPAYPFLRFPSQMTKTKTRREIPPRRPRAKPMKTNLIAPIPLKS